MTNRGKMIAGLPYDPYDADLVAARRRARELTFAFNTAAPSDEATRQQIFRELAGSTGTSFTVEPTFRCDYGFNIQWGEGAYANFDCIILDCAPVTIGRGVLMAPRVCIYTASHPLDPAERAAGVEFAKAVKIGDNVWLGGGAIVNSGVTIGENSVIGAGSVVTRDIPANVVAVGNPCRVLRSL